MVSTSTGLSDFEEMYLKKMFEIHSEQPSAIVKTSMLAESMGVTAASTTEMIQRLAGRDLVTYIPYKGSRLTSEGFAIAGRKAGFGSICCISPRHGRFWFGKQDHSRQ